VSQEFLAALNTAALAVMTGLLISGVLVTKAAHDWLKAELAKAQLQIKELIAERGKDMETIRENTQAMKDVSRALDASKRTVR
jgi:hypothetical protein